jgi:hypothetical protein
MAPHARRRGADLAEVVGAEAGVVREHLGERSLGHKIARDRGHRGAPPRARDVRGAHADVGGEAVAGEVAGQVGAGGGAGG